MPRTARAKSESGIYHIMLRGINRQKIFEEKEDQERFLKTLTRYKEQCGYSVYAYCLMDNHIHLLLKEGTDDLGLVFKRIAGSYVYWYNLKYNRCGHLFQDRFKSEPVDNDEYFLTVIRYIHQNPVKAGLCCSAEEYSFSSMREYLGQPSLTNTEFALSMLDKEQFLDFHRQESEDQCLDIEEHFRLADDAAKAIIYQVAACKNSTDFQCLNEPERSKYIRILHAKGLSIRQISRLTGVSKKTVELTLQETREPSPCL